MKLMALQMILKIRLGYVKICDIKNEDLSKFVRQSNHFNETIDNNNHKKTTPHNHIYMEKAYSKFYLSKYFKFFFR